MRVQRYEVESGELTNARDTDLAITQTVLVAEGAEDTFYFPKGRVDLLAHEGKQRTGFAGRGHIQTTRVGGGRDELGVVKREMDQPPVV